MLLHLLPHPLNKFLENSLEGVNPARLVLIGEVPEGASLVVVVDPSPPLASGFVPVYPLVAGGLTNDNYNEVNAQISEIRPWLVYDLGRTGKRSIHSNHNI